MEADLIVIFALPFENLQLYTHRRTKKINASFDSASPFVNDRDSIDPSRRPNRFTASIEAENESVREENGKFLSERRAATTGLRRRDRDRERERF